MTSHSNRPWIPGNRAQSWVALEELHGQGKLRSIGVSNYTLAHMRELMQSCKVPPAVLQVKYWKGECITRSTHLISSAFLFLQVEFHPQLCQPELRSLCKEYGVCFQAYSSLGQGELLTDPLINEVANNCKRTPAQVG